MNPHGLELWNMHYFKFNEEKWSLLKVQVIEKDFRYFDFVLQQSYSKQHFFRLNACMCQ